MLSSAFQNELDAARSVGYVTGRELESYDWCSQCKDFHDKSTSVNGRYDFHYGKDGALEVTLATSSAAERNQRGWDDYVTPHSDPALQAHWYLIVDGAAKVNAPRSKRGARNAKGFIDSVGPALAKLELQGVLDISMGDAHFNHPFHDSECPYGALRRAGVKSACARVASGDAGSIGVSLLFGYDDMPAFDEEGERKKEEKRRKKRKAKGEEDSDPSYVSSREPPLGPVQWSFDPGFISRLEARRAEDEQREVESMRMLAEGKYSESEAIERARRVVDERIAFARVMTWREGLPSLPEPKKADAGTELVDLLEVEFALHSDLAKKLLRVDPSRTRREVFFWLTWMRSSAWRRFTLHDRDPNLPDGVTGIWVGCLVDRTQVLHWDKQQGWTRHGLADSMPMPVCRS